MGGHGGGGVLGTVLMTCLMSWVLGGVSGQIPFQSSSPNSRPVPTFIAQPLIRAGSSRLSPRHGPRAALIQSKSRAAASPRPRATGTQGLDDGEAISEPLTILTGGKLDGASSSSHLSPSPAQLSKFPRTVSIDETSLGSPRQMLPNASSSSDAARKPSSPRTMIRGEFRKASSTRTLQTPRQAPRRSTLMTTKVTLNEQWAEAVTLLRSVTQGVYRVCMYFG